MPQPFEQFLLQNLEMFTKQEFRQEAKKLNVNEKIGDLAHFLIQNFKSETTNGEHVIDIAIRLLKKQVAAPTQIAETACRSRGIQGSKVEPNYYSSLIFNS